MVPMQEQLLTQRACLGRTTATSRTRSFTKSTWAVRVLEDPRVKERQVRVVRPGAPRHGRRRHRGREPGVADVLEAPRFPLVRERGDVSNRVHVRHARAELAVDEDLPPLGEIELAL